MVPKNDIPQKGRFVRGKVKLIRANYAMVYHPGRLQRRGIMSVGFGIASDRQRQLFEVSQIGHSVRRHPDQIDKMRTTARQQCQGGGDNQQGKGATKPRFWQLLHGAPSLWIVVRNAGLV